MRALLMMGLCFVGGACVVFGMAPAAVAVYVLCCCICGRVLLPCICTMLGVISGTLGVLRLQFSDTYLFFDVRYDGASVCTKYLVLLSVIMCVMKMMLVRSRRGREDDLYILSRLQPLIAAGIVAADIAIYSDAFVMGVIYGAIETVTALCLMNILRPALLRLGGDSRKSGGRMEADGSANDTNALIISLLGLSTMTLWIIPSDVYEGLSPAAVVSLAMVIYVVHRTGAAYGFGMAVVAGGILSVMEGRAEWLLQVLLISLVMLVGRALAGKRRLYTLLFYAVGAACVVVSGGMEVLYMSTAGAAMYLLNLTLPAVIFALIPPKLLGAVNESAGGMYMQAAATEMNRLAASKMEDMANTFRRLDYTFSGVDEPTISLSQVGELMDGFRQQITKIGEAREVTDERLVVRLKALGMEDITITICSEKNGRDRYYVAGRTASEGMVLSRQVAEVLGRYFGKNIRVGMNSPSLFFDEYRTAVYEESAMYRGRYHVRRLKKQGSPVSGDNFSIKEYEDGRLVMMLSDGMGSGSLASCESCLMLDTMEELLEAGFEPCYSVSFANDCLSRRNMGRTFTTFDMVIIDMYDGTMRSYKQGASATYILRPTGNGNTVEEITSTSLPIGVMENADCDIADGRLNDGDALVMLSDGISGMDMDDRLKRVLEELSVGDSRRMVDELLARMLGHESAVMMDDVTVMAVVVSKSEG